jgi:ATP-dependent HslUV protease ATP-binding subunit HslU
MKELTPREIVAALDRHIIGQQAAKRSVAVAVRNRWRRRQLDAALAAEIPPRNIIMVGPTGVGKTEIARRLASLVGAPFIKVEATKFTEVGYHGRDVESMIRDLLELAIKMVREEHADRVRARAEAAVEERLVALLLGEPDPDHTEPKWAANARKAREAAEITAAADGTAVTDGAAAADDDGPEPASDLPADEAEDDAHTRVRRRMREKLEEGFFDDREIEITVREKPSGGLSAMMGPEQFDPGLGKMIEGLMPQRERRRTVTVARARAILLEDETSRLVDEEKIVEQAIERTEQDGIVFLDEIDKIAAKDGRSADVSREGVQRDLLPIVEGSTVTTRHGVVRTDQILFVAAGAFHVASVSDLMPELQGRFPIRVELEALTRDDFRRILVEPDGAITTQQVALLGTEGLTIIFDDDAIDAMADLAAEANARMENIGARRLMTIMEQVFEDLAFEAPDRGASGDSEVRITAAFVRERLSSVLENEDLSHFVL